jgi:hypothetical protein
MALNPNIILSGGPGIDFVGSMDRGRMAAQSQIDRNNQNAFTAATRQHGAGAIQGDQAAINALAAHSPEMVQSIQGNSLGMENTRLGMRQTQQNMTFQAEQMQMARDEAKAAAAAAAQQMTAEQRAAELANGERVLAGLTQAQTAEQWDRMATQLGQPELVGGFEDRNIIFAMSEGAREALTAMADLAPKPLSTEGKLAADIAAGLVPAGTVGTPGVAITNNMGGTDKQIFDEVKASADAARAAASGLRAISEARTALQGGIISGFGADQMLGLQKLGAALGVVDTTAIQNTETFRSAIAPQVAAMLRATVGSANISNSDREFAEKAAGGSISLDDATIARLLEIMEKGNRAIVEGHEQRLNAVYPPDGGGYTRERALFGIEMPDIASPPPPTGATQPPPSAPAQLSPEAMQFLGGN